jgi:hypothetical protein
MYRLWSPELWHCVGLFPPGLCCSIHTAETSVKGLHTVMESVITHGFLLKLDLFYPLLQLIISLINVLLVYKSQSCLELLDLTLVITVFFTL